MAAEQKPMPHSDLSSASFWLTVVTVVRNDLKGFQSTLQSLATQNLEGVQFVVVDGSDSRRDISSALASFPTLVHEYVWAEPQGVYSAMNKGLELAKGEYTLFANAGDFFYDSSTLEILRGKVAKCGAPWVVGRVCISEQSGKTVVTPVLDFAEEKSRLFARGNFPPHQGTLVGSQLLKSLGGFSLDYLIAADYHVALRLSDMSNPLIIDQVIMTFNEGGTSTLNWKKSFNEFHRARCEVFQPRGFARARELLNTRWHFAQVWVYRSVLKRSE